jgi:group I intron endonuclease
MTNYEGLIASGGGTTQSFAKREGEHFSTLRKGKHANPHLQAAWKKYGEAAFTCVIFERCYPDLVNEGEQFWLDHYRKIAPEMLYNICPIAGSRKGVKHSEGT